ncbi:hypothetical protein ACNKXS_03305 [Christiangramia marina]|uniref:hypothetical protein n=1 Tax=Christiangramia marina TaxID=409436 RepID=UPI003AA8BFB0
MSKLTAHIVYATFQALDDSQREVFMQLIDDEKKKLKTRPKKRNGRYDRLPEKFRPENIEKLAAEISSR